MRTRPIPSAKRRLSTTTLLGVVLVLMAAAPAHAEPDGATYARVRYIEGDMTLERPATGEAAGAAVNTPIVGGDVAWTEAGRAEIELADGTLLRLDVDTRLHLRSLADVENRYEQTNLLALEHGAIRVDLREPESTDSVFEIDTAEGSIFLLSGGSFRIDADAGMTVVSSFRGVAEFSGDAGSILVRSGERSSLGIGRAPSDPRHFNTLRFDDFDQFVEDRADAFLQAPDDVPIDVIEEEVPVEIHHYIPELDYYGAWYTVPTYGRVWRPVYHSGWTPYVNGYWSWAPSGWVWVSYEPWGWAPYHYGRWDYLVDIGWFWIPGSYWSGAWVSFAVGPSYIGWCPLNYYNRPVFHAGHFGYRTTVDVTYLGHRGWSYLPIGQFGGRDSYRRTLRGDRLPSGTEVLITDGLPYFNARNVADNKGPRGRFLEEVRAKREPPSAPNERTDKPVPFRQLEQSARSKWQLETPRMDAPRGGIRAVPEPGIAPRGTIRSEPPRAATPRGAIRTDPKRVTTEPKRLTTAPTQQPKRSGPGPADVGKGGRPGETSNPSSRSTITSRQPAKKSAPKAPTTASPRVDLQRRPKPQPESAGPTTGSRSGRRDHVVERLIKGARRNSSTPRVSPPRSREGAKGRTSSQGVSSRKSKRDSQARSSSKRVSSSKSRGESKARPAPKSRESGSKKAPKRSPRKGDGR